MIKAKKMSKCENKQRSCNALSIKQRGINILESNYLKACEPEAKPEICSWGNKTNRQKQCTEMHMSGKEVI